MDETIPKNDQIEKVLLIHLLFPLVCLSIHLSCVFTRCAVNFTLEFTYLNDTFQFYFHIPIFHLFPYFQIDFA